MGAFVLMYVYGLFVPLLIQGEKGVIFFKLQEDLNGAYTGGVHYNRINTVSVNGLNIFKTQSPISIQCMIEFSKTCKQVRWSQG